MRALRLHRQIALVDDEVTRFIYDMTLNIAIMILFDAAVMQYLEEHIPGNDLDFNSWIYFMVITHCTVGYGDISPESVPGRIA